MSPVDCEQVLGEIERFLDGEVPRHKRAEIEEHLSGCDPCVGHAEFQRKLKDLLRSKCGCDEVPENLGRRIRAALEGLEPAPPRD